MTAAMAYKAGIGFSIREQAIAQSKDIVIEQV